MSITYLQAIRFIEILLCIFVVWGIACWVINGFLIENVITKKIVSKTLEYWHWKCVIKRNSSLLHHSVNRA